MSNYVIMTDSTTDLTKDFFDKNGVLHVPHGFILDGTEYKDIFWTEIGEKDFFETLRKSTAVSTTHPELIGLTEKVENAFKEGKDVLYICMPASLSGAFGTANIVKKELEEKYEDRRLYILDSCCASMGEGILALQAVKLYKEGRSMDEVIEVIEKERDKIYHFFTVDDLMHLKRGGRLSSTSAVMGTLIGIKPVLHVSDDGKLEAIGKVRGRHAALDKIVDMSLEKIDETSSTVYICNSDCKDDADYIAEKLKAAGVKETVIYTLGPDISVHVGVGTVGIIFHSEK